LFWFCFCFFVCLFLCFISRSEDGCIMLYQNITR
jgi:hypothetical protein